MGGTQHSKQRGRGDAPEIVLPRQMSKSVTLPSTGAKSIDLEKTLTSSPLSINNLGIDDRDKCISEDMPMEGRWNNLMEGMLSTPAHVIRNTSSDNIQAMTFHSSSSGISFIRPRQVYSKNVLGSMPTIPAATCNVANGSSAHNLLSLIPPKIRLQILSPVHSRQQMRVPSINKIEVEEHEEEQGQEQLTPKEIFEYKAKAKNGSSISFLKQPVSTSNDHGLRSEEESQQEIDIINSTYIPPRQLKNNHSSFHLQIQKQQLESPKRKNNKHEQSASGHSKQRRLPPRQPQPPEAHHHRAQGKNTNHRSPAIDSDYCDRGQSQRNTMRPASRSWSRSSHNGPNHKHRKNKNPGGSSSPRKNTYQNQGIPYLPSETPGESYERGESETRETTALSQSSSRRKLKVRGLKNFMDTHKPCPPLWAKQFPCRSKFHPDNYLYDFEGFNAPKRPVAAMEKCSKKCGRCNRCGVYVDNVCGKCSMCPADCNCKSKNNSSSINNKNNKSNSISSNASPSQFAPTAEHFISQLFGNGWSQTQKIEVNTLSEPDKPRLNLHQASSNNPLKIKSEVTEESKKPVNATGYDSYTPIPDPHPPQPPSYPPYPYGYGYPGFPAPASPYPYPYYPTYMAPMPPPMPAPYYGYSSAAPMHPNYNYQAAAQ